MQASGGLIQCKALFGAHMMFTQVVSRQAQARKKDELVRVRARGDLTAPPYPEVHRGLAAPFLILSLCAGGDMIGLRLLFVLDLDLGSVIIVCSYGPRPGISCLFSFGPGYVPLTF
ncbi:unnamed protein product [Discosporangium mesarthrocarpum]